MSARIMFTKHRNRKTLSADSRVFFFRGQTSDHSEFANIGQVLLQFILRLAFHLSTIALLLAVLQWHGRVEVKY